MRKRPVDPVTRLQLAQAMHGKKRLPKPLKPTYPRGAERYYKAKMSGLIDRVFDEALRGLERRYQRIADQFAGVARDEWDEEYEALIIHLTDEIRQVQFPGIPFGTPRPEQGMTESGTPRAGVTGNRARRRRAEIGTASPEAAAAASEAQVLGTAARMVNTTNKEAWSAQMRHVLGVDVFAAEPWLRPVMNGFAVENASLIKGMRDDTTKRIATTVYNAFQRGDSWRTLQAELMGTVKGISKRRAELIAVDQIGKLNGELSRQRQMDLGIDAYKWRGVLDNRERPEHVAREGKRFLWTQPPPDGHPGQPIRCRCDAEPDFNGLLEEYGNP